MKPLRIAFKISAISLFIWITLNGHISATTYHVSPEGKNSWPGNQSQPWRSLQKAADRVVAGDTVLVSDGVYKPFHVIRPGSSSARIEFKAVGKNVRINGYEFFDDREAAISVLADYVTIDGFSIDVGAKDGRVRSRGIRVSGEGGDFRKGDIVRNNVVRNAGWVGITTSYAEGVVIENNEVSDTKGQHGIYVANSADRPVVRRNRSHDNAEAGIQINGDRETAREYGGDGIISGAIVEGNIVYGNGRNGSAALDFASLQDSIVKNNLLYENQAGGIANSDNGDGAKYGCKNNKYLNNTVIQPRGARHALSLRHGSTGSLVLNNILIHLGVGDGLAVDPSSNDGLRSDYNALDRVEIPGGDLVTLDRWQRVWKQDIHSIEVASKDVFRNPSLKDYHLSLRSPAIDAGFSVREVTEDLEGNSRPLGRGSDMGAFEFVVQKNGKQ